MSKEDIIKELSKVYSELSQGDKGNPAILEDDMVKVKGLTPDENYQILELVANWFFKKEEKAKEDLIDKKCRLEEKLNILIKDE